MRFPLIPTQPCALNRTESLGQAFRNIQWNVQIAKELTLKHGLYLSPGKERVNRQQLKGQDKIKYELFDAIRAASKKVKSINELKQVLAKQGIITHLKYKSGTTQVQGISFSKGEYKFKGSEIDRSLSYAKLMQAIEQQQVKPEKSLADRLREVMGNAKQEREIQNKTVQTTYLTPEPETQYLRQSLLAGADLLGGLLGNIADDDDSPERKRRKKNEQQQSRGISR